VRGKRPTVAGIYLLCLWGALRTAVPGTAIQAGKMAPWPGLTCNLAGLTPVPGRDIQRYGPGGGYVLLDGEKITIRARVETLGGYSAHADQAGLVRFATGMRTPPTAIRLVHGEAPARLMAPSAAAKSGSGSLPFFCWGQHVACSGLDSTRIHVPSCKSLTPAIMRAKLKRHECVYRSPWQIFQASKDEYRSHDSPSWILQISWY